MERIKAIEEVENYVPVDGERWSEGSDPEKATEGLTYLGKCRITVEQL